MKVVIYGYSEVAKEILKILKSRAYSFLIADDKDESIQEAKQDGYDTCLINFNNDEDLIQIGIAQDVSVLFCVSGDYNTNLFVTLTSRHLDKNLIIISLVSEKSEEKKILLAGATKTISPYEIGAHHIMRMIKKPTVFKTLDKIFLSSDTIKIAQIEIDEGSFLDGIRFKDIEIEKEFNLLIIGIENTKRKGVFLFNTKKINRKINNNDILVIMGNNANIQKLKKELKR